jgi:DNA helicase-2/ATP-dependent DNA helicase PcrA
MLDAVRTFPMKPKQAAAAAAFLRAFDFNWQEMPPADAAETLLDRAGYIQMWNESKDADKDDRLKNIRELIRGVISKFDTIGDFLEQAALMTADDERETDSDSVSIMTIHAAKGLEFDTVFLPAWEDGIFPNDLAISEGGIEEERRLAYVSITRAKHHCIILHAESRFQYGSFQNNQPSRFIAEIDEKFLDFGPGGARSPRAAFHSREERGARDFWRKPTTQSAPKKKGNVGKTFTDDKFGLGVIIEESGDHWIVAFKGGIKKVPRKI